MGRGDITKIDEIKIHLQRDQFGVNNKYLPVRSSNDTAHILRKIIQAEEMEVREKMVALYFNRRNALIGYFIAGVGGVSGTMADPKLILGIALKTLASGIIIAHNHPSGNLKSSEPDLKLTKDLKQAAAYHDIMLLDHIILTRESHFSYLDEGLMGISNSYSISPEVTQLEAVQLIEEEPLEVVEQNELERLKEELQSYIAENTKL